MPVTDQSSWQVVEDVPEDLHVVLFVRDALRLSVRERVGGLVPRAPDLSSMLKWGTRRRAACSWPDWWTRVVAAHRAQADASPDVVENAGGELTELRAEARHQAMVYPPFVSLADSPALQEAAQTVFGEFGAWWYPPARSRQPRAHRHLPRIPGATGRTVDLAHRRPVVNDVVRELEGTLGRKVRPFRFAVDVLAVSGSVPVRQTARYALVPAELFTDTAGYRAWLYDALAPVA